MYVCMCVYMYLKSCRGLYGITVTGLSNGRLCTNISPLNVRLIRQGQPAGAHIILFILYIHAYTECMHIIMLHTYVCTYVHIPVLRLGIINKN